MVARRANPTLQAPPREMAARPPSPLDTRGCHARSAALTRSGRSGRLRILTPVASKMALEIADASTLQAGSPVPVGEISGWLIRTDATFGASAMVRMG